MVILTRYKPGFSACTFKVPEYSPAEICEMFGFKYVDYFAMVRNLIEEYRILFIDWVAGFDKWDYIIDRRGLFNPPDVGPFDKDVDDDIPIFVYQPCFAYDFSYPDKAVPQTA